MENGRLFKIACDFIQKRGGDINVKSVQDRMTSIKLAVLYCQLSSARLK
jgi:hypothetical protein